MGRDVITYTREGYINMGALLKRESLPFIWITGARGAGKTYGAIETYLHRDKKPFILMRRTKVQAAFAGSIEATPIKKNLRAGQELRESQTKVKDLYRLDLMEGETLKNWVYCLALSGVASMRGIDLSECDTIVFDEFIKEPHERPITREFDAFLNAIETIGRNREVEGLPPLKVVALSNALDLDNPYYRGLGIVDKVYKMDCDNWRDPSRGIAVYRPKSLRFISAKKKTSLYQFGDANRTLGNAWTKIDEKDIRSRSLKGATPICSIDGIGFYRISGGLYASPTLPSGVPSYDLNLTVDRAEVHRRYQGMIDAIFYRKITFESIAMMYRVREMIESL